jgi:toxin ParE1/3/4
MPRVKLIWMPRAQSDLRDLKNCIVQTAPKNAQRYVQKIKAAAKRLKRFPEIGWIVDEFQDPELREIVLGSHRVIYRYRNNTVAILSVFRGSRILRREHLEGE